MIHLVDHERCTQLFKLSYENFLPLIKFNKFDLPSLYISKIGVTLMVASDGDEEDDGLVYNSKDNSVERIGMTSNIN